MSDTPDQEKSIATFIARLVYCGMGMEKAVEHGYELAISLVMDYERVGAKPTHEHMRKASFLLSGAMPEVPKWLAAWQLHEEERER